MALGVINTGQTLLTQWLNECTYQLGSIGSPDEDGIWEDLKSNWQSGTTIDNRRAIRVGKMAISLEFENGPKVILGSLTDSTNNSWGGVTDENDPTSSWISGKYNLLANQLRGDDVKIKFCPNLIAPLKQPDATGNWTGGGQVAWNAGENVATLWKSSMKAEGTPAPEYGRGWGVTIGSLAGAPAASVGSEVEPQHGPSTIAINSPTGMASGPLAAQQTHDVDTFLYTYEASGQSWTLVNGDYDQPSKWGSQEVQVSPNRMVLDGMNGYNYGGLTNIQFWITMSGIVKKKDGSGNSVVWPENFWFPLITQEITYNSDGTVSNDQADGAVEATDESIKKLGWLGPLDITTDGDGATEPDIYKLDINDAVQDVRVRFSLDGRTTTGISSGCWAPKDFLNWCFRASWTSTWNGTVLYPSRFSILSAYNDVTWRTDKAYELYSGINGSNTHGGFRRLGELIQSQGVNNTNDFQYIQKLGWSTTAHDGGPGPVLQLLTTKITHSPDGEDGLVHTLTPESVTTHLIESSTELSTNFVPPSASVANFGEALKLLRYYTSAGIPDGQEGYWDGLSPTETDEDGDPISNWASVANLYKSAGGEINLTTYPNLIISMTGEKLTLLLFDPMLWWDNDTHPRGSSSDTLITQRNGVNGGTWASPSDTGGYWDNPDYLFIKVFQFTPPASFINGDKLHFQIPLGASIA